MTSFAVEDFLLLNFILLNKLCAQERLLIVFGNNNLGYRFNDAFAVETATVRVITVLRFDVNRMYLWTIITRTVAVSTAKAS